MSIPRIEKNDKTSPQDQAMNAAGKGIMDSFISVLRSIAEWMQQKTERLSAKSKSIVLLLFCIVSCGYSIYLLTTNLAGKPGHFFLVTPVKKPGYIGQTTSRGTKVSEIITSKEYKKIHQFKGFIDSLAKSSPGIRFRDSILASRPGLMDSIFLIENFYQSTIKK